MAIILAASMDRMTALVGQLCLLWSNKLYLRIGHVVPCYAEGDSLAGFEDGSPWPDAYL